MKRSVRILPEADQEMLEAAVFYESHREGLSVAFLEEIDRSIQEILDSPEAGVICRQDRRFRQRVVRRFPYKIMYKVLPEQVEIAAVMHTSRLPAYWLGRAR